jgi:hypothetical protein
VRIRSDTEQEYVEPGQARIAEFQTECGFLFRSVLEACCVVCGSVVLTAEGVRRTELVNAFPGNPELVEKRSTGLNGVAVPVSCGQEAFVTPPEIHC